MNNQAMTPVSKDSPLAKAWEAYKAGQSYQNTRKWALHEKHVDGSLWAAFMAGFEAGKRSAEEARKVAELFALAPEMADFLARVCRDLNVCTLSKASHLYDLRADANALLARLEARP